jgi:hypothetical protein
VGHGEVDEFLVIGVGAGQRDFGAASTTGGLRIEAGQHLVGVDLVEGHARYDFG